MLDWLKETLGDHYSEDIDRKVSAEIGKGFVSRTDFNDLNGKLKDANATIKTFTEMDVDGVKRAATEWEQKYNALQADMQQKEYGYAAQSAAAGLKFSSESAKKAFIAELAGKKLPVQDGALLGFDDFVKGYKERDAAAFAGDAPPPRVASSTPGAQQQPGDDKKAQANSALRSLFGKE